MSIVTFASIPTSVRAGFELRSLPHRATPLSQETLKNVTGGCAGGDQGCLVDCDCCSKKCVEIVQLCTF